MVSERTLFSVADAVKAVSGRFVSGGRFSGSDTSAHRTYICSVEVDSRKCGKGSAFFALKGDRTDGHLHIRDAYGRGSRVFVIKSGNGLTVMPDSIGTDSVFIEVDEPLHALQTLARWYLSGLPEVYRIGITGSNGKTTTKELVGSILGRAAGTAMNRGNLNSEIGLPLAVFDVKPEHRYAVFEMAMDHTGEMDILSDIVMPSCALVTNIGSAHIGRLGSIEAIAAEKKKIFSRFTGKETAFIPEHDSWFSFLSEGIHGTVVPYGTSMTGFEGLEDLGLEGSIICWRGLRIRLPLPGRHNVMNALGAIALVSGLDINPLIVKDGIENVPRLFGRSEVLKGRITVIQDCYNANPDSMGKALEFIKTLSSPHKKILVLGSMRELGETTVSAHENLGRLAMDTGADSVLFFGEETRDGYNTLLDSGYRGFIYWTTMIDDLVDRVRGIVSEGDLVFIKGSRALELERLTEELAVSMCLTAEETAAGKMVE